MAPEMNHLCPSSTHSSPASVAAVKMFVGSLLAASGSESAKQERTSSSRSGRAKRSTCSGVPYSSSTSALPVSGNEQLNTAGATSSE
jgi:hypothetical protein